MKVAYLGAGTWGTCLASVLASNGHDVWVWTTREAFAEELNRTRLHPDLPGFVLPEGLRFSTDLKQVLDNASMIAEAVTSAGIRPVFQKVKPLIHKKCPIVLTSKGIEQKTGLLLGDVVAEVLGEEYRPFIGYLSGPSHAEEVVAKLPTSIVSSAYDPEVMHVIRDAFATDTLRIYPNSDMNGVQFGGAMKNIIAIACGIADGLSFGDNTKAALMTRGLHEIRKLSVVKGCRQETLMGLAGMGDLCVTCLSKFSRNNRFGHLIAQGYNLEQAKEKIGVVVEGAYSCVSALQLGKSANIALPITEAVYNILYEGLPPKEAVKQLLQRVTKEEHL